MKIALLQTNIDWQQKGANIARYTELISALPSDSRLAVLPEMFTTGFTMTQVPSLAESNNGATVQWMCDTARTKRMALCGSLIISEDGYFFNRLFFVFPDGSFRTYDKRHLFTMGGEAEVFSAGNVRLTVEYEGWRICPLICYDLRFPVWSRNYSSDFDLLLYVGNWPQSRVQAWSTLLPARAVENQCYVAGVNRVGKDGHGAIHNGQSTIVNYKGETMQQADDSEAILTADLSLYELRKFRDKFPAWRDADKFVIN